MKTISRRLATVLAAAVLALSVVACGGDPADEEQVSVTDGPANVTVEDNSFAPANLSVPAGTTVNWEWVGDSDHNVVGEGFESETQSSGAFGHTFEDPGTYEYSCTLHGSMNGIVEVTS
ncbi:MAG: hypothetical protein GEU81_11975 [Nitriliruptorales bacterium]|nr:hypothetical protein [Nitriliruptorales bacterium]